MKFFNQSVLPAFIEAGAFRAQRYLDHLKEISDQDKNDFSFFNIELEMVQGMYSHRNCSKKHVQSTQNLLCEKFEEYQKRYPEIHQGSIYEIHKEVQDFQLKSFARSHEENRQWKILDEDSIISFLLENKDSNFIKKCYTNNSGLQYNNPAYFLCASDKSVIDLINYDTVTSLLQKKIIKYQSLNFVLNPEAKKELLQFKIRTIL